MAKSRRVHSDQFKRNAVERWVTSGSPAAVIGRELGIVPTLLPIWREKYAAETSSAVNGRVESLEDENRRLRRENASLREDREILEKAAATSTGQCNTNDKSCCEVIDEASWSTRLVRRPEARTLDAMEKRRVDERH